MLYGELQELILQLLNQYSMAGETISPAYNNQADAIARIPLLVRDGLNYMATTVRRLRAVAPLENPREAGQWLLFDLPEDLYQLAGGILELDGGSVRRIHSYRLLGGRQVLLPKAPGRQYLAEYFRYPRSPGSNPAADAELDCPPEAQTALAYYVASHLAMEDNNYLHGALYNEFEMKMARLQEGPFLECGVTENVYEA